MKQAISFTGVAVAGALVGFLVMRAKSPTGGNPPVSPTTQSKVAGNAPASKTAADPDEGPAKHDLVSLLKWSRQHESSGNPVAREMERLDKGELRALLVDLARDEHADPQTSGISAQAAAKELFKREGAAAFDWVAGLGDGVRKALYPRILQAALEADPIAYKAKFDDYAKEFGEGAAKSFIYPMIGGATDRGAEDLIKLRETYGDLLNQFMLPTGTLPEDFDFHRFFTGMPPAFKEGMRNTFQYWSAKDREAAWSGFKELTNSGAAGAGGYFPCLFDGVAAVAGPAKAAEWLAPKLAELTSEQRNKALGYFGLNGTLEVETVRTLIPLLGNDADRMKLAQRAVAASSSGSPAGAAALAALDSDQRRTEVLLNHVRTFGFEKMPPSSRDRLRGVLETMMQTVKLPEAMRNQVTAEIESRSGGGK
ncbi:hypothetical protein [Haloferula sp. BvORR071]|uniref:hypothetical protein n=1 Tax=Haloferula sp. BvORR071 TaxID=1396141 RepID=UPI000556507C|nr:hypothetical protein [Haloferula sp. BvORR071]